MRIERDTLGEVRVPADALYGAQTQRAVENYPVSGLREHPQFIRAFILLKRAAALVLTLGFTVVLSAQARGGRTIVAELPTEESGYVRQNYVKGSVDRMTYEGKIWGYPTEHQAPALIYRPEIGRAARVGVQWTFAAR